MGEIIIPKVVERETGYLYYIDGEGNVCRAKLARGGRKGSKNKRKYIREEEKKEMEF